MIQRFAILLFLLLYFTVALIWPSLRVWRRTGVVPATFLRTRAPLQRIVGATFSLLILLMVLWACLVAFRPDALFLWPAPAFVTALGWLLMVTGLAITVAAQIQMGSSWRIGIDSEATPLVTRGLFGWVRNPIFSSMLLTILGLVLVAPSWISLAGWVATAAVIAIQVRLEERHLMTLHGAAYLEYAGRVGRFVPGLGRLGKTD